MLFEDLLPLQTLDYLRCMPWQNFYWWWYNALAVVPVTLMWIYSIITRKDYSKMNFHGGKGRKKIRGTTLDMLWRVYCSGAFLYYVMDFYVIC